MTSNTRVAIVTGAGSGIGRASALALAGDGFDVVLAGRRSTALGETESAILGLGHHAQSVPCDVRDEDSVRSLFAAVRDNLGRIDLLFNNAGIASPSRRLEDIPLEEWESVVSTNVTGAFLCTREAFKAMKGQSPRGGRIINNGSVSAHAPRPSMAPYTAAKHAITGLTRQCALEGRPYDIACGQIDIGNALTAPSGDLSFKGREQPDGSLRDEPTMDMADVGRAVSFMASLPLSANVLFLTVMATSMPFIGRG